MQSSGGHSGNLMTRIFLFTSLELNFYKFDMVISSSMYMRYNLEANSPFDFEWSRLGFITIIIFMTWRHRVYAMVTRCFT